MYIIFGKEQADKLSKSHTVLELDTIRFLPSNTVFTVYAVIENVSITDMPLLEGKKEMHATLMENYRKKDWNYCEQAIEQLASSFDGELDSFYAELQSRINKFKETDPGAEWDSYIERPDPV